MERAPGPSEPCSVSSVVVVTASRLTTRHSSSIPWKRFSSSVLGSYRDDVIGAEHSRKVAASPSPTNVGKNRCVPTPPPPPVAATAAAAAA